MQAHCRDTLVVLYKRKDSEKFCWEDLAEVYNRGNRWGGQARVG